MWNPDIIKESPTWLLSPDNKAFIWRNSDMLWKLFENSFYISKSSDPDENLDKLSRRF